MLAIVNLRCNHQKTPFGITGSPFFSWQLKSAEQNTVQEAYQLRICLSGECVFDSGKNVSSQSVEVMPGGFDITPGEGYQWTVKVWDNHGNEAKNEDYFESAPERLSAKWIEPSIPSVMYEKPISLIQNMIFKTKPKLPVDERLLPVSLLRKEFGVKPGLIKARAFQRTVRRGNEPDGSVIFRCMHRPLLIIRI